MDNLQPLINESAQLMLIGMGTVFIILVMLIFLITLVSKTLARFNFVDEPETTRAAFGVPRKTAPNTDNELIAVISSAIKAYKNRHSGR